MPKFSSGHGHQYLESSQAGEVVRVETDGKDEGFWTSSIRVRVSEQGKGSKVHCGVLLDDDVNALLCQVVFSLPRTQLVMLIDSCKYV